MSKGGALLYSPSTAVGSEIQWPGGSDDGSLREWSNGELLRSFEMLEGVQSIQVGPGVVDLSGLYFGIEFL